MILEPFVFFFSISQAIANNGAPSISADWVLVLLASLVTALSFRMLYKIEKSIERQDQHLLKHDLHLAKHDIEILQCQKEALDLKEKQGSAIAKEIREIGTTLINKFAILNSNKDDNK